MKNLFVYLFWPNPGNAHYDNPKVMLVIAVCVLLVVAAVVISFWRKRLQNQQLRKLSRSWSSASAWFGLTGILLTVSRVENIQFLAMRALWGFWLAVLVLYVYAQVRGYRAKYYEVVPVTSPKDPRSKYLPKRKNR